jgi:5'-methylthioadenosine phosphorylase
LRDAGGPSAPPAAEGFGCPAGGRDAAEGGPPSETDANAELERLLREISSTIRHRGRRVLAEMGITLPQFDALNQLLRHGEMTMGELCERLQVASSTVTDLTDRMERAELVRRCKDGSDRRVVRLHVTERGRAVIDAVLRARAAYVGAVIESLPARRRAGVLGAIRLLHAHVTRPESP